MTESLYKLHRISDLTTYLVVKLRSSQIHLQMAKGAGGVCVSFFAFLKKIEIEFFSDWQSSSLVILNFERQHCCCSLDLILKDPLGHRI